MTRRSNNTSVHTSNNKRTSHQTRTNALPVLGWCIGLVVAVYSLCVQPRKLAGFVLLLSFVIQPLTTHAELLETEQSAVDDPAPVINDSDPEPATEEAEAESERVSTEDPPDTTTEEDNTAEDVAETTETEVIDQQTHEEPVVAPDESPPRGTSSPPEQLEQLDIPQESSTLSGDVVVSEPATTSGAVATTSDSIDRASSSTAQASSTSTGGSVDREEVDTTTGVATTSSTATSSSSTASTTQEDTAEPPVATGTAESDEDTADTESEIVYAATSTPATTSQPTLSVVQTIDNEFSFSKAECTLVEDGSYYCQKGSPTLSQKDDLFAAPDAGGDLEIFIRRAGNETQLTQNAVDDASPYFDPRSNTIVWHRLINDRYQIVSYDIADGTEIVLTNTTVNNMQPTRSGDITVWQRWVDNNWEIILFDGNEEIQLTDSIEHDIAPNIRGELVIWNVRASDGTHSLQTYDITTGVFTAIADPDGVAVANPRMVVVYDAVYENGDTVMKGYDLVTGQVIPLNETPRDLPEELPAPDSTGETRALVQPAPVKPEHEEVDLEPDTEPTIDPPVTGTTTATSTLGFDLDLRASTTEPVVEPTASTSPDIPDLVIEPLSSTTATSTQTS